MLLAAEAASQRELRDGDDGLAFMGERVSSI